MISPQTETAEKSPYASVKLPAALVNQARQSAAVFRRSVAGQIEYWAALGQSMERSNLTVREARDVLESPQANLQANPQASLQADAKMAFAENAGLAAVKARILQSSQNGSLAASVQKTVAGNKARSVKAA